MGFSNGPSSILLHVGSFQISFVEKSVLSPIECSWHPCPKLFHHTYEGVLWGSLLCSIGLCDMSIFVPILQLSRLMQIFEISEQGSSSLSPLLQDCLVTQSTLRFHMNFRLNFSVSAKNIIGIDRN